MRVIVLGSTGMLGWAVGSYFNSKYPKTTFLSYKSKELAYGKNSFYFDVFTPSTWNNLREADLVINCIGAISHNHQYVQNYTKINSEFPHNLAIVCEARKMKLIHVTSDCVFSGKSGMYDERDVHDPVDDYGASKSKGEPDNCMVLRTSIIGEELRGKFNLLEWTKSQRGKTVKGYTNHFWNGVTTKCFAQLCDRIITNNLYVQGTRHIFSETKSKYEMLKSFNEAFKLKLKIEPAETEISVNRTLNSLYDLTSKLHIPSYDEMIKEYVK